MNKRLLISIITILFLSSCEFAEKQKQELLEFKTEIISRTNDTLLVSTEFINNTDSALPYITMSCDTLAVYRVDSKKWELDGVICEKNVPIDKILDSHKSVTQTIRLLPIDTGLKSDGVLKIGFKLFDNYDVHIESNGKIIWSKNLLD